MDENEIHEIEEHLEPETPRSRPDDSAGVPWAAILLLIWAVSLIIFSVQNAEQATVEFLAWQWQMPLALLVMVTALATLVLTGLGSAIYRRRRRKNRRLRAKTESDL